MLFASILALRSASASLSGPDVDTVALDAQYSSTFKFAQQHSERRPACAMFDIQRPTQLGNHHPQVVVSWDPKSDVHKSSWKCAFVSGTSCACQHLTTAEQAQYGATCHMVTSFNGITHFLDGCNDSDFILGDTHARPVTDDGNDNGDTSNDGGDTSGTCNTAITSRCGDSQGPCIDLRESRFPANHFVMYLTSPGNAYISYCEADACHAHNFGPWTCTSSNSGDGLSGDWACPGNPLTDDNTDNLHVASGFTGGYTSTRDIDNIGVCIGSNDDSRNDGGDTSNDGGDTSNDTQPGPDGCYGQPVSCGPDFTLQDGWCVSDASSRCAGLDADGNPDRVITVEYKDTAFSHSLEECKQKCVDLGLAECKGVSFANQINNLGTIMNECALVAGDNYRDKNIHINDLRVNPIGSAFPDAPGMVAKRMWQVRSSTNKNIEHSSPNVHLGMINFDTIPDAWNDRKCLALPYCGDARQFAPSAEVATYQFCEDGESKMTGTQPYCQRVGRCSAHAGEKIIMSSFEFGQVNKHQCMQTCYVNGGGDCRAASWNEDTSQCLHVWRASAGDVAPPPNIALNPILGEYYQTFTEGTVSGVIQPGHIDATNGASNEYCLTWDF